ncbi:FkbM family methyltransferase [Orrella sp. NBD-18]|uniref:FkbM family methyltransferase n=1 Tax=Sheuella amnicola TaxID=2707330 RepID=A0A6B2R851_9BURK|nr:FkbM family methyltransferase [Sheuella amnicola]NDY83475.1 FkbM family methyltransferase [Sheuella amnicola]
MKAYKKIDFIFKKFFKGKDNSILEQNSNGKTTIEILKSGLTPPQICYAQDGEDLVLARLLENNEKGFYIDIGAHHPTRFSNTYLFYLRGWSGINVDAQPESMDVFKKHRPRDINIECGIGLSKGEENYYQFNEPALNTFDQEEAKIKSVSPYKIINVVKVEVRRLEEILDIHLSPSQSIDFMSIDVEGKDLEVLQSNNWLKYRPKYILAETLRTNIDKISECPLSMYLSSVGYDPICKVYNTIFFESRD